MDNFKKVLDEKLLCYVNQYKLSRFKAEFSTIYEAYLEFFKDFSSSLTTQGNDKILVLKLDNFEKVRLKENKTIIFLFCGTFFYKENLVTLVRKVDSFDYFICDDVNITRQLNKYPIGIKIGFKKHSKGIDMLVVDNSCKIGLFDELKDE